MLIRMFFILCFLRQGFVLPIAPAGFSIPKRLHKKTGVPSKSPPSNIAKGARPFFPELAIGQVLKSKIKQKISFFCKKPMFVGFLRSWGENVNPPIAILTPPLFAWDSTPVFFTYLIADQELNIKKLNLSSLCLYEFWDIY